MNGRYVNPHPQMVVQQQMPQQPQYVQTPQGMMMVGNDGMLYPVQQPQQPQQHMVRQPVMQMPQQAQPQQPQYVQTPQGMMMVGNDGMLYPVQQPQQRMGGRRYTASATANVGGLPQGSIMGQQFATLPDQTPTSSNSRFDNIRQLTQSNPAQQPPQRTAAVNPEYQQPPQQQPPVVVAAPPKLVASPPTNATGGINDSRVKLEVRAIPFSDKDVSVSDDDAATIYAESVQQVLSVITEAAHTDKDTTKSVYVRNTLVCEKYFGVTLGEKENSIFHGDVESVYRFLKTVCPDVSSKRELCFYNAVNAWLTDSINDYLMVATRGETLIDSFYEDFNDLFGYISNNKTVFDGLMSCMNDLLDQAKDDIDAMRVCEDGVEPIIATSVAVIPKRINVVYTKLMGYELGDTGKPEGEKAGSKLLGSLKNYVDTQVFYLGSLDSKVYKVYNCLEGDLVLVSL